MRRMRELVSTNDVHAWSASFLSALADARQ
jgi:trehalose-6-phosphate synthase